MSKKIFLFAFLCSVLFLTGCTQDLYTPADETPAVAPDGAQPAEEEVVTDEEVAEEEAAEEETVDEEEPAEEEVAEEETVVLLADSTYNLRFTTNKECKDYFSVKEVQPYEGSTALKSYSVSVPGSKDWPSDSSAWVTYAIYTQVAYDEIDPHTLPGTPKIIMTLDSELLLTRHDPQDSPRDMCGIVTPEKL